MVLELINGIYSITVGVSLAGFGGASLVGGLTAIFSGPAFGTIKKLGEVSVKYAQPIGMLAGSMDLLATAMERVVTANLRLQDAIRDDMALGRLATAGRGLIAATAGIPATAAVPVDNYVRIDIDGRKVASAVSRTMLDLKGR